MQEAPQSVSAGGALSAPLLPIPQYRLRTFTEGVGERLREGAAKGVSEAEVLASIRTERTALATAIDSEPFRAAFAQSYFEQFQALNPAAGMTLAAARAATDDIVNHRVNDARQLAALVQQPDFITAARAAKAKRRGDYQLPPEKIEEMIAHFSADPKDGITHAQQSMAGHRLGHAALAKAYDEQNSLLNVLAEQLKPLLQDEESARRLATDWMEARRNPANATVAVLQEDGQVYRGVMQRIGAANATPSARIYGAAAPGAATSAAAATTQFDNPLGLHRLNSTTGLTPMEIERNKTTKERANEWAYTMNHALSCGTTDVFIQPFVSTWVSNKVDSGTLPKWTQKFFENHDHHHHGPGEACDHPHPPAGSKKQTPSLMHNAGHWLGGEVIGDVGAVPLTVMVQRYAPTFMHGLRNLLEPMAKRVFEKGAERDSRRWALKQRELPNEEQIEAKRQELYNYEMDHLPQAVVWNAFSIPINLFAQKKWFHTDQSWPALVLGKTFGAVISNTALIGGRALAPGAFHRWDEWNSKNVVVPISTALGVERKYAEEAAERHHHAGHGGAKAWEGRLVPQNAQEMTAPF